MLARQCYYLTCSCSLHIVIHKNKAPWIKTHPHSHYPILKPIILVGNMKKWLYIMVSSLLLNDLGCYHRSYSIAWPNLLISVGISWTSVPKIYMQKNLIQLIHPTVWVLNPCTPAYKSLLDQLKLSGTYYKFYQSVKFRKGEHRKFLSLKIWIVNFWGFQSRTPIKQNLLIFFPLFSIICFQYLI